jgi:hypothetical protein
MEFAINRIQLEIGGQTSDARGLLLGGQDGRKKGQDSKSGEEKDSFKSVERHVTTSFKIRDFTP